MRIPTRRLLLPLVVCLAVLAGCASNRATGTPSPRFDRNVIAASEIAAAETRTTALQLIQRLRAVWLHRTTYAPPAVYVNEQLAGDSPLTRYVAGELREIRYLSAVEATQKFGGSDRSGAILLTTH